MSVEKTMNILSLEGSIQDFEFIGNQLTQAGINFNIVRVDTENNFVSALHNTKYDNFLAGFKLPGFDASKALQRSKDICPDVPFICVSGVISEETIIELIKSES